MIQQSAYGEGAPAMNRGNVVYYAPLDRSVDKEMIFKKCEETGGSGLVIEDNTIYEIDCDCYNQMLKRNAKKNQCVDPFQS